MKKIKYIIQILAVIAVFGCTEDDAFKSNKGDIRVTAGFASTRTTFTEDNGTVHVTWNKEDEIGLFTNEQMNLRYTAQKEGSETEFSATDEKLKATEGQKVYAYYPYSGKHPSVDVPVSKQRIALPDLLAQEYKENASESDFIYSEGNITNNKLSLKFKHLFAFLKIIIPLNMLSTGEGNGLYIHSTDDISCSAYFNLENKEISSERYQELYYYIPNDDKLKEKQNITCYIAILPQTQETELKIYNMKDRKPYNILVQKQVPIGGFKAGNVYMLYINESQAQIEKDALIALYKATNGDKWVRKDNWCSDKPLSEWYGVECFQPNSEVWNLFLESNNLTGILPSEIGNLTNLLHLSLAYNSIEGSIPIELGNLTKIYDIYINDNKLSGKIPPELGDGFALIDKPFHLNFSRNNLVGEIPQSFGKLKNLIGIDILENKLSGHIPESFMQLDFWQYLWPWMLPQRGEGFDRSSLILRGPAFSVTTYTGEQLNQEIYNRNKYTILLDWRNLPSTNKYIPGLKEIYNNYKKKGIEIIGYSGDIDDAGIAAFANKHNISWPMFWFDGGGYGSTRKMLMNTYTPAINVVDSEGNIVIDSYYTSLENMSTEEHLQILAQFFQEKLGNPDPIDPEIPDDPNKPYESTDYSKDGNVTLLQQATEGKGIDIVLMGDAYSDRLIADGTYKTVMQKAADYLFTEEPLKSFRNLFNIYMVDVVSMNEVYGGETALSTYFGGMTLVGGDDDKCFEYAQKAISDERMNEALIVVMINSTRYAGTCYMYNPNISNDYGSGLSVAYFPVGTDEETFEQVLHHEACGHGFSKLADEYAYQNYGAMPTNEIQDYQTIGANYGWWKNVDFTSDPTQVKWSKFISDNRYKNDKLGVFQGACTYWTGAYRPTDVSIMRYNTDGFNAPSRESIYYRIHRLAYGSPWAFDYETFVAYDAINRKAATRAATWNPAATKRFRENHCPPVVVKGSWRNAKRSR